ncbi:hypothetical protein MTO96_050245, partial [Rhipicephalus appendiculatus]
VVIAGPRDDPGTKELLSCLRRHFLPFVTVILADQDPENPLRKRLANSTATPASTGSPPPTSARTSSAPSPSRPLPSSKRC